MLPQLFKDTKHIASYRSMSQLIAPDNKKYSFNLRNIATRRIKSCNVTTIIETNSNISHQIMP